MYFIIGLGNPGSEYKGTRHNVGFAVIEKLAKDNRIKLKEKVHSSLIGRGRICGQMVTLVQPQTFMNLSGKAVKEIAGTRETAPDNILVVCDDINLELGKIRLRKYGSSGGQKGLESIIRALGTENFARLRVGIATDIHKGDISGYVLSPFGRKDRRHASHAIALASEAIACMLEDGIEKAMTTFNKKKVGTS